MASKGMPSLLALLGLAAVAGYQNRDKLRDMIGGSGEPVPAGGGASGSAGGSGGLLGEIGKMFGSDDSGNSLKDGLDSLVDRFRTAGQGAKADSWVSSGANDAIEEDELESALGSDTLDELAAKTGLTRADILSRLKTSLPDTVHHLTPDGRVQS